jgi:hydrophobe/amphiphile efflux-1 (HAE1) family protein
MFVEFFIRRPIFATVLALIITLAGAICIPGLPIALFPEITPPTVQVKATYTGAPAEVVEGTVTTPLEEEINGVQGMIYMSSVSANDGSSVIIASFNVGYDLDIAAVDVQNRAQIAQAQLPSDVTRQGVTVKKQSTDLTVVVNLISPDDSRDELYLSNYATINIIEVLKRIPGVGDVVNFVGQDYSMRIWLDPDRLANLGLAAADVVAAVREQNAQVPSGQIGQPPAPKGQQFQYPIVTLGRLADVPQFEDIIVRTKPDGSVVRVRDVGRVDLGAQSYNSYSRLNGQPSIPIGVFQLPGGNALDVANQVRATMDKLAPRFPSGVSYRIAYDTTMFVRESIKEVLITLLEALGLVILVVFVFLQGWRATLIPAITIPVSLVGTFALMKVFGFSINTLTMFGLVLAIGLVVDDAIVVVENVSRLLEDRTKSLREAASQAMAEVTGPIIATSLVLMAVFVPVGFTPGTSGQLYQQFALTIAISVALSTINALTLSPALCAVILRPAAPRGWFFLGFNRVFAWSTAAYERLVERLSRRWLIVVVGFVLLLGVTYSLFRSVPTGFVPDEDQGYIIVSVQGPDGAALERTRAVGDRVNQILMDTPGIRDVLVIGGFNFLNQTTAPNVATCFVILKPWAERKTPELRLEGIFAHVRRQFAGIADAQVFAFGPPPIRGLSATGGVQMQVQDLGGQDLRTLDRVTQQIIQQGNQRSDLVGLFTTFRATTPQLYVDIDRTKAKSLGVDVSDIASTLQVYLGSLYVNDFNKYGRVYRVFMQAEAGARARSADIGRLYVRNAQGRMIPLSTLVTVSSQVGPQTVDHYNLFRTAQITASPAPGRSSGEAIAAMEELTRQLLPAGMGFEWTGIAFQELEAGNLAPIIFSLALVFVFLFLAAQYESWIMPLMVMLAVPLALLGALGAQHLRGLANDIYCQIGLVMLIGLASKNAILIVEFARRRRDEGLTIEQAAMEAARIRLRPILMTSFAFILGVLPLTIATGAGAAGRHSLGTAVFGGMVVSTFLNLLVVPVFYVLIERLRERRRGPAAAPERSQVV